jgi:hypothetical protein
MIAELTNFLIALAAEFFFLAVGIVWSRGAWSHGMFGFDLGYLVVAVLVFRILSAKMGGSTSGLKEWFLMILPAGPCWLLEALADYSLSNLKHDPTKPHLGAFVLFSCLMLVSLLVWAIAFPLGNSRDPASNNEKILTWRRIASWTGVLLGITLLLSTGWLLLRTTTPILDVLQELQTLESWL